MDEEVEVAIMVELLVVSDVRELCKIQCLVVRRYGVRSLTLPLV